MRDQRAQYLVLEIKNSEIARISFERVKYDVEKEIKIAYERELSYIKLYRETLRTCKYCYTPELISLENRQIRMESKYDD